MIMPHMTPQVLFPHLVVASKSKAKKLCSQAITFTREDKLGFLVSYRAHSKLITSEIQPNPNFGVLYALKAFRILKHEMRSLCKNLAFKPTQITVGLYLIFVTLHG